jgi:hypothetical protein
MITLQINEKSFGLDDVKDEFDTYGKKFLTAITTSFRDAALSTDKFQHGVKFDQGVKTEVISSFEAVVTSKSYNYKGTEYSNFLEFGNLPVDGKFMRFKIDGHWISTYKRAAIAEEHLGFWTDATNETEGKIEEIWNNVRTE